MPNVGAALLRAEESRRLNVRALAQPDSGPALRHGMESLEHASVTVRSMFRAIVDAARQRDAVDGFGPDLSIAYASVLRDFAEPLRTFGRLVRTEARPRDASDNAGQLRDALGGFSRRGPDSPILSLLTRAPIRHSIRSPSPAGNGGSLAARAGRSGS